MTLYIIILHYKNIDDTLTCLRSIFSVRKTDVDCRVIIVNNNPDRRDLGKLIKNISHQKSTKVIHNPKNFGFAKGMNIGIRVAMKSSDADYILILNNDTVLPKNFLTLLAKKPEGITSPVIKFKSLKGKWVYDFGGMINRYTGRTTHREYDNPIKARKYLPVPDYVSGCCMLIKRDVFDAVGLFDESFYFYFEDADFCIRARKMNFPITVDVTVFVEHKLGGSIGRWSHRAIFYNLWGNFLFITKHLGFRRPIGYIYLLLLSGKIVIDLLKEK